MRRLLGLVRLFWGCAVAAEMEYRLNFVVAALSSAGGLAGSLFGLHLFYRAGHELGGWSWEEALAVLGFFVLFQGIAATFLQPNLSAIVRYVQQGTLDFVLLKPIDSQLWLSARLISLWGLPDVALGLGLIAYAALRTGASGSGLLLALPLFAAALVSFYSLWFVLGATSIWFVKIYNATEVLRGLLEAGRFPSSALPTAYRLFFTFVVPVTFLTTVPAAAVLGRELAWPALAGSAGLALALALGARRFWRWALRFYTSASS